MARIRLLPILVAALGTLVLAGCSTPAVLMWQRDVPEGDHGSSMPSAMLYLDRARNAYRGTIAEQMAEEATLASSLVGAGALVAALAVGNAHRDTIIGTTLLAGTAYGIGNMNLKRQRLLAFQAGIDALNCSERAVIPFAVSPGDLARIVSALDELEMSRRTLIEATNRAKGVQDSLKPAPTPTLDETVRTADLTQQAADTTLKAGRQYSVSASRAARELVAAVNRIDAAVVRAAIATTPDLTAVPGVISGLAGMAGSFAPGSGVETRISESLNAAVAANVSAKSDVRLREDPQVKANDALVQAMQDTAQKNATASALLAGRAAPWAEDAFKDCGVAQVVAPLTVSPSALTFTVEVDARRVLDISGGVKPFFVEIDGTSVDGFSVKAPVRFDSRAEVSIVGSKVKTPFDTTLRVSDSSPTARVITVPVSVARPIVSSNGAVAGAAAAAGKGAADSTIESALAKLKAKGSFKFSDKSFNIPAQPSKLNDKMIEVPLKCPDGEQAKFKSADLAEALLVEIGITEKPPRRTWNLRFKPVGAGCLAD